MRGVYRFLKSTMLGGLVFLVPLIVIGAITAWGVDFAIKIAMPALQWLPDKSVGGVSVVVSIALGALVLACFLAGLLAETTLVKCFGGVAERLALSVPGYALLKSVGADLVGIERKKPTKTVLVRLEASAQLGFLMDTLADGRHVVFIPGVPRALVGTLHIVAPERVQVLAISIPAALDALGRLGVGLREMWPREPAQ